MVENWIDEIAKLAETVTFRGRQVRAFRLSEKKDYPASLADGNFPCAVTLVRGVKGTYSYGPNIEYWRGMTEFHLTTGLDLAQLPDIMPVFARIRTAFLSNRDLSDKVNYFDFDPAEDLTIRGPVRMQLGTEAEHFGLIAYWVVKDEVSDEITLS